MYNNKDIIKELQKLKSVKPDDGFLFKNREKLVSLMAMDSAQQEKKEKELVKLRKMCYNIPQIFYKLARPVGVLLLTLGILTGGGAGISFASYNSVPGDVFYPVKLTIEKAQISLKSKEEDKVKLEVEFAGRRIEEINKVKAKKEPENTKIALDNFKKNIETVQQRLEKMKEQEFTSETAEIVNLVEEKTGEYTMALKNMSNPLEEIKEEEVKEEEAKIDELEVNETEISSSTEEIIDNNEDLEDNLIAEDNGDLIENATTTPINEGEVLDNIDLEKSSSTDDLFVLATTTPSIIKKDNKEKTIVNENKNSDEINDGLKEAMEISDNLGIKAVDIIIKNKDNGGISLSQEEIAKKVKNKAEDIKTKVDNIQINLDEKAKISTTTIDVILNSKTEKDNATETVKADGVVEKKNDMDETTTATDITKINNALGEVDKLIEDGDLKTAFDKVKEANELKKSVEIKIENVKKEDLLKTAEIKENLSEHEK